MRHLLAATFTLGSCLLLHGGIASGDSQSFDFTKISKTDSRITFEPADKLSLTKDGLGWDGDAKSSWDGSFTTAPLAVGMAWRPLTQLTLTGVITPPPQSVKNDYGQTYRPWRGQVFARYSPDKKHWSTWHPLEIVAEPKEDDKGTQFRGSMQVPEIERKQYGTLYDEYRQLDVEWKSDEEAMVKWILQKQPDFFAQSLPFIGYIQLHFEAPFAGGQRLKSFEYNISWGMSGLSYVPRDRNHKTPDGPWRFDATTKEK